MNVDRRQYLDDQSVCYRNTQVREVVEWAVNLDGCLITGDVRRWAKNPVLEAHPRLQISQGKYELFDWVVHCPLPSNVPVLYINISYWKHRLYCYRCVAAVAAAAVASVVGTTRWHTAPAFSCTLVTSWQVYRELYSLIKSTNLPGQLYSTLVYNMTRAASSTKLCV